nr:MAG TPA: hypothetical protein [Caudoviricetes sp.]
MPPANSPQDRPHYAGFSFYLIFKVRKSHFGFMTFIQLFRYNTVLLRFILSES